jgi:hypothetical protein
LCKICHSSSIKRLGQARALMTQVAKQLKRIGMDFEIRYLSALRHAAR